MKDVHGTFNALLALYDVHRGRCRDATHPRWAFDEESAFGVSGVPAGGAHIPRRICRLSYTVRPSFTTDGVIICNQTYLNAAHRAVCVSKSSICLPLHLHYPDERDRILLSSPLDWNDNTD